MVRHWDGATGSFFAAGHALRIMERSVPLLERHAPDSKLLALFYRWIISGYIYCGYREGLREVCLTGMQSNQRPSPGTELL